MEISRLQRRVIGKKVKQTDTLTTLGRYKRGETESAR
jgi:hypothetical protein